ncbi:MAG TPA: lipoyl(octanoyl) transferase LipB [Dehalococcoidia bacterium]|jgi:lipoate-protein ligase B|nr:lipoyl(octanoyl) transferase LipB [Dehalococcoidia bacterium]
MSHTENVLTKQRVYLADYLGIIPYQPALKLQERLAQARAEDEIPDVLLLLQHPPTFTIGRFRGKADIINIPREAAVFPTNRGGGVTYHGPGQLVGYPILNLKENGLGVRQYIGKLEEVIIKLLLGFGIRGHRVAEHPGGVWAGEHKICSIGIHVSHHITTHGFALNVSPDLGYFEYIKPCGLDGPVMTSISKLLGYPVEVEAIIPNLLNAFSEVFGLKRKSGLGQYHLDFSPSPR